MTFVKLTDSFGKDIWINFANVVGIAKINDGQSELIVAGRDNILIHEDANEIVAKANKGGLRIAD